MIALTECQVKGVLQYWRVICRLSRIDPEKSRVVRRERDGQHFLLAVFL